MKRLLAGSTLLLLAGCGSAVGLQPPPGVALPPAAYGAEAPRTPTQLVTPTPQQRPQRSDELLQSSQDRRADDFDLPPDDAPADAVPDAVPGNTVD